MFKVFQHYVPVSLVILALAEIGILIGSVLYGEIIHNDLTADDSAELIQHITIQALIFAGIMFAALVAIGLYWRGGKESLLGRWSRVALGFLLGTGGVLVLSPFFPYLSFERETFLLITGLGFVGVLIARELHSLLVDREALKRRLLVLGAGKNASQLEDLDLRDVRLVGYVPVAGQQLVDNNKIVCSDQPLYEVARDYRVNEIVVALDERRKNFPIDDLLECKMRGIKVVDLVSFYEARTGQIRLDALNPSSLIFSDGFRKSVLISSSKRLFDILVSLVLLIVALPVMVLTAFGIFLESRCREPVLYRQVRVGKDGVCFKVLKFRTMSVDAEKDGTPKWADKNDSRVTKIGKFLRKLRIDELPQLINVIKGEMSFVGPRPERPEFVSQLASEIPYYLLRHKVKPGITGWAQIAYPYGSTVQDAVEKLQYDLYYLKNYSMLFDLYILFQTVHTVLWGRGAR
jgi:sugar transferase (PEP-CTERM system associated)